MNKVIISGRITRDPETKFSQSGMAILRFSLAVDRNVSRDSNGERAADFINCVAFSQQADFISRYVRKGNMLLVEGRIQTSQYQAQDGSNRYSTDVIVERVENMSPRDNNQSQVQHQQNPYQGYNNPTYGQPRSNSQPNYQTNYQQQSQNTSETPDTFNVGITDDDMPF